MRALSCIVLCGTLVILACGPSEPADQEPTATDEQLAVEEDEAQEAQEPPGRRPSPPLPAAMVRPAGDPTFTHNPHVDVACATCHESVPGHEAHSPVACRECHTRPAAAPASPPAAAVCASCHHGEEQARTCQECHAPVAPLRTERTVQLGVWPTPRTRTLPFAHARHEPTECMTCHTTRPGLVAATPCAQCHENHHRPDAACMGCHPEPAEGVHPLEAHLGCSGAGCHADPVVNALPTTPPFCLSCHQEQVDHNPGRDCADCHQIRGTPQAWEGGAEPAWIHHPTGVGR